jgi:hypothetical protein
MTEATTTTAEVVKDTTTETDTTTTDTQTTATDVSTATDTQTGTTTETATTEADKADKAAWGDDWRDQMAGGDDDVAAIIKRYGSPKAVAKALKEARAVISSGKLQKAQPDPKDEKAMAEWRKEQGVPDDPSGYKLPETVVKRMSDEDKPMLASFTDFAHKKGAPQAVIDIAAEWYFESAEQAAEQQTAADTEAREETETELRKDWAHGEYKANMTLAKRWIEAIPGVGDAWSEARLPDGRLLGSVPEFIAWASDQGRQTFGDVTFANGDSEKKHTARKTEIEGVMKTDIDKYYQDGLDKEYAVILEREQKRAK